LSEAQHQAGCAGDHQDWPYGVDADVSKVKIGCEVEDRANRNQKDRAADSH
jgi:hypothetical protein